VLPPDGDTENNRVAMVTSLRFSLAYQTLNTESLLQSGILLKMSTLNINILSSEHARNDIYITETLQAKFHLNYS
jgi:hypothetical protein